MVTHTKHISPDNASSCNSFFLPINGVNPKVSNQMALPSSPVCSETTRTAFSGHMGDTTTPEGTCFPQLLRCPHMLMPRLSSLQPGSISLLRPQGCVYHSRGLSSLVSPQKSQVCLCQRFQGLSPPLTWPATVCPHCPSTTYSSGSSPMCC